MSIKRTINKEGITIKEEYGSGDIFFFYNTGIIKERRLTGGIIIKYDNKGNLIKRIIQPTQ